MNNDAGNIEFLCQSCHMKEHWRVWKLSKLEVVP